MDPKESQTPAWEAAVGAKLDKLVKTAFETFNIAINHINNDSETIRKVAAEVARGLAPSDGGIDKESVNAVVAKYPIFDIFRQEFVESFDKNLEEWKMSMKPFFESEEMRIFAQHDSRQRLRKQASNKFLEAWS
ncbi:MAG: hypothetical protein Q9178_000203 [Gyalolechia marmorata]